MASGKLTIKRTDQYTNRNRKIQLFMDGVLLSEMANNETKDFEIDEGAYKLYAKIDMCRTPEIAVDIAANGHRQLELGSPIVSGTAQQYAPVLFLAVLIGGNIAARQLNKPFIQWLTLAVVFAGMIGVYFFMNTKPAIYYVLFARTKFIYLKEV
jgi:hypothetical protein